MNKLLTRNNIPREDVEDYKRLLAGIHKKNYEIVTKDYQRVLSDGINDCAIAYRSNLGKNNIDFANRAFEFIKNSDDCCIVVGDFKGFLIISTMPI